MTKPIEFGSFYKLLSEVIKGNHQSKKELECLLAKYEHAKEATSAYDELGQIFCHHSLMELYKYTGVDEIDYITRLDNKVWEYLNKRMDKNLREYIIEKLIKHSNQHNLTNKISTKWGTTMNELDENIEGLAEYVVDGIMDLIN